MNIQEQYDERATNADEVVRDLFGDNGENLGRDCKNTLLSSVNFFRC